MGSSSSKQLFSYDETIRRFTPTDVCPPEQVEVIKQERLAELREDLVKVLENHGPVVILEPRTQLDECTMVEYRNEWGHVGTALVPKKYKNGFDTIVKQNDVYKLVAEVIKEKYTIHPGNRQYAIHFVQNA